MTRRWGVGVSALCPHTPRCTNVHDVEDGTDVTPPCSGLTMKEATAIVAVHNEWAALTDRVRASLDAILGGL
jgi:hypothetical protein